MRLQEREGWYYFLREEVGIATEFWVIMDAEKPLLL
jgi:hypothetical protein